MIKPALYLIAAALLAAPATAGARSFTTKVDNPWFPLKPGTTFVYKGKDEGKHTRDVFAVTHRTRVIDGVRCVVIDDRLHTEGRLSEHTRDYYVQDGHGTVWYFGEDTALLDSHGRVTSREGTWHAGVDGARAGIFMPAHPRVGEHHFQEHYTGHAEDEFRVRSLHARITVPFGSFKNALETRETTRLEPGVVDSKHYVRGVGEVSEASVKGGHETLSLVKIKRR